MKKLPIYSLITCVSLLAFQSSVLADAKHTSTSTKQQLILTVDANQLASRADNLNKSSYSDQKIQAFAFNTNVDALSKKLKKASKTFKRFTSLRYGKQQKIRAKLGKSSLTLKYTRIL